MTVSETVSGDASSVEVRMRGDGEQRAAVLTLDDGRTVRVRLLSAEDAEALRLAIADTDFDTLRRRFLGAPPRLSMLVQRLRDMNGYNRYVIGGFDEEDRLVAVAEWARDGDDTAEIAVAVAESWRRVGLARAMLERVGESARDVGFRRLSATFLADNEPVARLLRASGWTVSPITDGTQSAVLDL